MRAADLDRARSLLDRLALDREIAARLAAQESPALVLREPAVEIVLSPAYLGRIRDDVGRAVAARIADTEAALRALGVEP